MTRVRRVGGNRRTALDSGWQFAAAASGTARDALDSLTWLPAGVPGTAAGSLRAAGLWDFDQPRDFDAEDFWWRLQFRAEPGTAVLGFDGLATLAEAWLDGQPILASDNMFRAHEVPVQLGGVHELLVRCRALAPELAKRRRPRPRWRVPMLEQQALRWFRTTLLGRTPGWSPPCAAVGPWRGIWLETRTIEIGPTRLDARLDGNRGRIAITASLNTGVEQATLVVERADQAVRIPLAPADGQWQGEGAIADVAPWWPHTHGEPALYDARLELRHAGGDSVAELGRIGFRTIEIDQADGDFQVRVNGVPVFCRGACWTPLNPVTLVASADACRSAVAQAREAGMNMLRVGGTMVYADDVFLDAMDEAGILLWQDAMFANMDYPDDDAFAAAALSEVEQQLARLHSHPCLALLCGNSEVDQQAAMSGAPRECWSPPLFHQRIAELAREHEVAYAPSSACGGSFPHAAGAGPTSYYGVGAYLRPLEDARRSKLRFASECLAFANIPDDGGLPKPQPRVHHPLWKQRSPRDLGAGWDFDDVRDHYLQRLYGVDPTALRATDHDRYLALGRAVTGEVMARCFAEWRRPGSPTRGALVWFLRDLWPGAGWGVVDANGDPKPCWHDLRRALAPVALAITDEGVNGLAMHVCNDPATELQASLEIDLFRNGEVPVGQARTDIEVPAHGAATIPAAGLFDEWLDLSWAHRFGPPLADVVHARLTQGDTLLADAFWFPAGLPATREAEVGLSAEIVSAAGEDPVLRIGARRFAQSVWIEAPGHAPADNGFHLAPGQSRDVALHARPSAARSPARGTIAALNAETGAGFRLP